MKKKLTIGIFNDSFFPMADGVVMVVDNYARELSKVANVIVFVPKYKNEAKNDREYPYKVIRCNTLSVPSLEYTVPTPKLDKEFMNELSKYKLDIVHIHSPFMMGKVGLGYAREHNIPCIATMHSQFKKDFQKIVKKEFLVNALTNQIIKTYDECDECWAVNSEVARIFFEDYGCKNLPRVMNNATSMEPVTNESNAKEIVNKKYNIKDNERLFLFVGRINTLKNILFIVDALKIVKEENPSLEFKMLFVGTGPDEALLKSKIKENKLDKNVLLIGKIMDREMLANIYCRADLMLFPSTYDASSIVQIEAASQKTPTIFLRNTATASTVTDNVNGFLSDNSVYAYANKITEVLNNEKLYKKVSNNAYKDLYVTWEDKVKEAYNLYLEIIKKYHK